MRAILLAGGYGKRLRPITEIIPKALVPIQDKPILQIIIESFQKNFDTKFLFSLGYKSELIENYLDSNLMKLINKDLRLKIVKMITNANEGHIPSSLSIVDIINFLYQKKLKQNFNKKDKDYFILSKGHAATALYGALNYKGIISNNKIKNYW